MPRAGPTPRGFFVSGAMGRAVRGPRCFPGRAGVKETTMDRVQIFDTTLRDGEQSPGATMNVEEKLAIARQLEHLGVDVIEAGFAASSEGDFESVRRVAEAVTKPIVLSLARTREQDVDRAIRAVEKAKRPGIHIFIATSDIHLKHKLMMSRKDVLDAAVCAVKRAKQHLDYVEFSAEDASRSDPAYLIEVFGAVIDAGARTVNVPTSPPSRPLAQIPGTPTPINKPIVGDNAFAHEAGTHQDGVLKNRLNYEIMKPESVGLDSNRLVLGKHSGRHALVERLRELGLDLTHVDMNRIFDRFKTLADAKQDVYDEDLIALVAEESVRGQGGRDRYELVYLNVTSSSMAVPHATVKLRIDGEEVLGHGTGDGMVDACYKVIGDLTGQHPQLERYAVKAITGGTDAPGEGSVLVREHDHTVTGQGSHTDIIQASALAYVNALNKLEYRRQYRQRQQAEGGP